MHIPSGNVEDEGVATETFSGPSRVFLKPGLLDWLLLVKTTLGWEQIAFKVHLLAGHRYRVDVQEDDDLVTYDLYDLAPASYATLYPHDAAGSR